MARWGVPPWAPFLSDRWQDGRPTEGRPYKLGQYQRGACYDDVRELLAACTARFAIGTTAVIVVPSSFESISSLPPSWRKRCCIPGMPTPISINSSESFRSLVCLLTVSPRPLSRTSRNISPDLLVSLMLAVSLSEWRRTFV